METVEFKFINESYYCGYKCSKPNDQSGRYVKAEVAEQLEAENKRLRDNWGEMVQAESDGLEPQTSYRMLKEALENFPNTAVETKQNEKEN